MKKAHVEEMFRRLAAERPAPETELAFDTPFTLLVAVVLSAQATDVGVNKATPALFAAADTPAKMAALGELPAGLAHELNNPAAAASRASSQLLESLGDLQSTTIELTRVGIDHQL